MEYLIRIDEFEGPLDLLLHLVKESNIDIRDIKIIEITEQYMDYIRKMEELNIDVASEYLVMAATLMEIKSKSLLPEDKNKDDEEDDDEEVSREALIQKLIDYEKYKEIIICHFLNTDACINSVNVRCSSMGEYNRAHTTVDG